MELFELLLYTTAFSQLSYGHFFDFCLFNIFLKYVYAYKPLDYEYNQNPIDFTSCLISFAHVVLHVINFYMYSLCQKCYTYKHGKYIIDNYNYVNKKYLFLRFKIMYYGFLVPFKFICKKFILSDIPEENINKFKQLVNLNIVNNNLKKENKNIDVELKTNQQIDLFLDKILMKSNKNLD